MALKCVECGKPASSGLQVYCECTGYIEPYKKNPAVNKLKSKKKRS